MTFCSLACRQKAYRARGGHASGTTGAQRRRNEQRNTAHHDEHSTRIDSLTRRVATTARIRRSSFGAREPPR